MFYSDLMLFTEALADPSLSELLVNKSLEVVAWMARHGIDWELHMNHVAKVKGQYIWRSGTIPVAAPAGRQRIRSKAVILACGGFESNPEMRARYLGQNWDLVKVRGTRYNTGDGITMATDIGAEPFA